MKTCEARRTGGGDQIMCARCGLNWDVDDPDPPQCPRTSTPAKPEQIEDCYEVAEIPADAWAALRDADKARANSRLTPYGRYVIDGPGSAPHHGPCRTPR